MIVLEFTFQSPENGPRALASRLALCLVGLFAGGSTAIAQGPLPTFEFQGIALHPKDLAYSPNDDLIHPTIVKTEGRVKNPLGKYYLYHAPHKHIATSMAYSDSLDGPWTEYKRNPVVEGPSAPEIRWIEQHGKFFLWGHRKNSQTELWTSEDGLNFEYDSVSITAGNIGTRNATYNRVYEYPLKRFGSRYITLYSGFIEGREIRCIWLAHSKDAKNWTQIKTPLVEPVEGDNDNLYGPSLLQWKGRNYVVYQDMTSWRGGNLKYVEIDRELNSVGAGGRRFVLVDPPSEPPLNDRLRGAEFYLEDNTLYLYSSASRDPRLIVYAKAKVAQNDVITAPAHGPELPSVPAAESANPDTHSPDTQPESGDSLKTERARLKEAKRKAKDASRRTKEKKAAPQSTGTSLDDILKGAELETVYETTFDEPLRLIREQKLLEGGKYARLPAADVDWVLEGPGEVTVKGGRMHFKNSPQGNAVVWNTREFPESFVAEWDFQHHHARGTAIIFFAAQGADGGSIYSPGLPQRTGNFGNYTRGKIRCYHTSYSATDEEGVPRGDTHLKKDILDDALGAGGKLAAGPSHIDGKTGKAHRLRLAKLGNRIILEVNGVISFDCIDDGEKGGPAFKEGQIGFRQMRHCIECSYGGLKVQRITQPASQSGRSQTKPTLPGVGRNQTRSATARSVAGAVDSPKYPDVDELPILVKLPDPFRFFRSHRRVASLQDWKERKAEIRRLDEHYSVGPAFPQTHNARIENVESTDVFDGRATHYQVSLAVGPKHAIQSRFEYVMPEGDGPKPLIFYICPRKEYADECRPWQEKIIDRGYAFAWAIPGQFNGYGDHGPVKDAFPQVKGNTMMAWVWGINELIHHLETRHDFDRIIITGTSRFGKTATAAGVVNENIDLTVPVTGGFAVELFNLTNNKMTAEQMAKKCYANETMTTFAGQLERLPIDEHFRGALIAPRAYLGIMGAENDKKNGSHIEAYEALVPVYDWLGVKQKVGLYDHSPHGHGICEDDMHTIMDFADSIFYGKEPKSGKAFDQFSNPDVIGFEWKAPASPITESGDK